jgi:hypothetical protein
MAKTFVYRIILAVVWFATPAMKFAFILPDNLNTAICRTAVDDDVFKIRIILRQNTLNGLFVSEPPSTPCSKIKHRYGWGFHQNGTPHETDRKTIALSTPHPVRR